jgi:hypothetical protein
MRESEREREQSRIRDYIRSEIIPLADKGRFPEHERSATYAGSPVVDEHALFKLALETRRAKPCAQVCCLLSAVCCVLSAACYVLPAVCCLLSAVCSAVCCLLSTVCCLLFTVFHLLLACLPFTICSSAVDCLLYAVCCWLTPLSSLQAGRTNPFHGICCLLSVI